MSLSLVLSSVPSADMAASLARTLVNERLAACCSVLPPMLSVYHWNDAVEETTEVLLMMKTTPERVEALTSRLAALHPYEVPEVLVTDASASDAYEAWVRREAGPR